MPGDAFRPTPNRLLKQAPTGAKPRGRGRCRSAGFPARSPLAEKVSLAKASSYRCRAGATTRQTGRFSNRYGYGRFSRGLDGLPRGRLSPDQANLPRNDGPRRSPIRKPLFVPDPQDQSAEPVAESPLPRHAHHWPVPDIAPSGPGPRAVAAPFRTGGRDSGEYQNPVRSPRTLPQSDHLHGRGIRPPPPGPTGPAGPPGARSRRRGRRAR